MTETLTPTNTLLDQLKDDRNRQAKAHADAKREYGEICARAATPEPDDAGRLQVLAMELNIDPATLELHVKHAVEEGRHRQRIEALKQDESEALERAEAARRKETEYSALLAAAGNDAEQLRLAAQAGAVAFLAMQNWNSTHPAYVQAIGSYLRSRGWREMAGGWADPLVPTGYSAMGTARNLQLARDLPRLFTDEVWRQFAAESERIISAWKGKTEDAPALATVA